MGGLIFVIVFVLCLVWPLISRALNSSGNGRTQRDFERHVRKAREKGLAIRCVPDHFTADDGEQLPIMKVEVSGSILVPRDQQPVSFRVRLRDITDSEEDAHPVICTIPDLANEDGIFSFDQETTIPYQFSEVREMQITAIPMFALLLPHKGQRRLQVCVGVTHPTDLDTMFAYGEVTIGHLQPTTGYMEFKERSVQQEHAIAKLALAMCSIDGQLDKREKAIIKRFFTEHFSGREDEAERKQRVEATLKGTLASFQSRSLKPAEVIKQVCADMRNSDDPSFTQVAYELCVDIAAADGSVAKNEEKALEFIARQLGLPDSFVRETHDRKLRLSMYQAAEEEALIDMPDGLSHDEKIAFLNREYQKWRARVTHKDPAIATEAELRIQQITRARRELQEAEA